MRGAVGVAFDVASSKSHSGEASGQTTMILLPESGPQAAHATRARAARRTDQRSELNAARTSCVKSSGSSQAAKWPPLSTSLK